MDASDCNFDEYIDDYQKQRHILASKLGDDRDSNSSHINSNKSKHRKHKKLAGMKPSPNCRLKTFTLTNEDFNNIGSATPIKLSTRHDNEVIVTRVTGENSLIAIATLSGKLVTLSVHLTNKKVQSYSAEDEIFNNNNNHQVNGIIDSDIPSEILRARLCSNKSDTLCEGSLSAETFVTGGNSFLKT